jgi:dTDP-4-dehydrorhamnose reductase
VGRPSCPRPLEHPISDPVGQGRKRVVITGAGGQLGTALAEAFPEADARDRASFDIEDPPELGYRPDLILHAAAWTNVDGAESTPAEAVRVNVRGTRNVVSLGAPVLCYSTDYVFDGRKGEPYVESDEPNPLSVYGRTKLEGEREVRDGWVVRSSWLFGWTSKNFVKTMLALGEEQDEGVLDLPYGTYHLAADGDATWAEFAEAIFEEAGIDCRVRRITTGEFPRDAERPAYSVLRSERGAPTLPHWREGLRAVLKRL